MTLRVINKKTGDVREYHYTDAVIVGGSIVVGRDDDPATVYSSLECIVTASEDDHVYTVDNGKKVKIR